MSSVPPLSPWATLEVTCRQFPYTPTASRVLRLRCSLAVGFCLALSQSRPEVLVNQHLQERPPVKERSQQKYSSSSPQGNKRCVPQFLTGPSRLNLHGPQWWLAHQHTLRWLSSSSRFPTSLSCFLESLPNELFAFSNPCLRVCFWGTQTKMNIKPSSWHLERCPSMTPHRQGSSLESNNTETIWAMIFSILPRIVHN